MRGTTWSLALGLVLIAMSASARSLDEQDRSPEDDAHALPPAKSTDARSYDEQSQCFIDDVPVPLIAAPLLHDLSTSPGGLFGTDVEIDYLIRIDPRTAESHLVGGLASPAVASLAYDAATGSLYGTDASTSALLRIDPRTGHTTIVGYTGLLRPHGAAIDPADGTLYVIDSLANSRLFRVDKESGKATPVGLTRFPNIGALDFDPTTGECYGAYASWDDRGFLIRIDAATGLGTLVASSHRYTSLAFDEDGVLYAADNGNSNIIPSSLYRVDKQDGSWTRIARMDMGNVLGIAFAANVGPRVVDMDILPAECPNVLDVSSFAAGRATGLRGGGLLPVVILGDADFDVASVDVATVRLEGVAPMSARGRTRLGDVSSPLSTIDPCDCSPSGPEGIADLTLWFDSRDVAAAMPRVHAGDDAELLLQGALLDGTPFQASDCVHVAGRGRGSWEVQMAPEVSLEPARPNPFNPLTVIRYSASRETRVRLGIYDLRGRLVAVLLDGVVAAGDHEEIWDARDEPSGLYLARLEVGGVVQTRRLILLK